MAVTNVFAWFGDSIWPQREGGELVAKSIKSVRLALPICIDAHVEFEVHLDTEQTLELSTSAHPCTFEILTLMADHNAFL